MPALDLPADYYVLLQAGSWGFYLDGFGLIADGFESYAEAAEAADTHSYGLSDEIGRAA